MIKKKISKVLALAAVACSAIAFAPHGTVANASQTTGVVTAKSGLNLRKSASTSAKIIKTIPHNGQVNIKSKSGNWYNVEHNGSKGYVSADYVKQGSSSSSSTQTVGRVTAKSGLNLRKSASTSAKIIKTIPHNGQVNIKGKSGNWYNVEHNGSKGYVSADYIQKGSASLSNTQNNATSKYDKILSAMKSQLGKKYCYGGSSPSTGFDCSGLMQWGFKQGGVSIGRTTYDQARNGVGVSVKNAQPGDLLLYSDKSHVGMYIGNGQWIESPNSRSVVRITNVPWSKIGIARRVL
ncbi:C40 family peptidase [Clostridium sp.]|uniref:C40 family peptidase n=1 Tax=Clostridium sp. TaxID=1506 RepID=UPI002A909465|nr:C40 family peptidase [Clostridium sp.]MDY6013327.1 C40 family peptidase [Clostridium sp.]